jgi:Phage integrase family/Phage integrase, N-terminal SAM-like domain
VERRVKSQSANPWRSPIMAVPVRQPSHRQDAVQGRQKVYNGIDPLEQEEAEKKRQQAERAKDITLGEAAKEWVEASQLDWEPITLSGNQHRLDKHILPKLGHLPMRDFDMTLPENRATAIVEEFLKPYWRKQTNTGNKCRAHLYGILDRAIARKLIGPGNAASMKKDSALRVLLKHPNDFYKPKGFEYLPFDQLPEFMAKLRGRLQKAGLLRAGSQDPRCQVCASPEVEEIHAARLARTSFTNLAAKFGINRGTIFRHFQVHFNAPNVRKIGAPIGALALEFIVLVPARKMQVQAARWTDIREIEGIQCLVSPVERDDGPLGKRQGHKTAKKTGKEYVIPLSDQAVALLDRIKKWQDANGIKSDYVFPGGQGGKASDHLEHSTVNKFLRNSLGYRDITVHGFRHTFGDWAEYNEYDDTNSEIALGHIVGSKSRRAYKDAIQRLRAIHRMVQAYAVYCDQIPPLPSEKKPEDNVASLERERAARRNAG